MTVKELKEALSQYPDDMDVDVHTHWDGWQTIDKVEKAQNPYSRSLSVDGSSMRFLRSDVSGKVITKLIKR